MPTPPEPGSGDGTGFAATFARSTRTPVRAFLPGRRAWLGAGAGAAGVLLLAGITAGLTQLDFGSGGKTANAAALPSHPASPAPHTTPGSAPSTPHAATTAPPGTSQQAPATASGAQAGGSQAGDGQNSASALLASIASAPAPGSGGAQRSSVTAAGSGYLSAHTSVSSGGNAYWSQSIVTVTTTAPLNSLKVAVRIVQTGGVASTGTWSSLGGNAGAAVYATGTAVNYEFTLKPGVVLQPGRYVFEVQYNHAAGTRSTTHDLYAVVATASSGPQESTDGHF